MAATPGHHWSTEGAPSKPSTSTRLSSTGKERAPRTATPACARARQQLHSDASAGDSAEHQTTYVQSLVRPTSTIGLIQSQAPNDAWTQQNLSHPSRAARSKGDAKPPTHRLCRGRCGAANGDAPRCARRRQVSRTYLHL